MKVLAFALLLTLTSCMTTFYYPNGQPSARISGDYTHEKSASGAEKITVKHSPVIRAGGIAAAQGVTAGGTGVSAVMLAR